MVPFLTNAITRATHYAAELTAVNYTPAMTLALTVAKDELDTANQNQNSAIGDRKTKTKLRR
jgi:hypothetical protein